MIYLVGILVLGFLVFVHELGHFLVAKINKIPVTIFSLGFGPILLHFKRKETEYKLCLFPLGGYVSLDGETKESDNPNSYINRPWYIRMMVLLGGVTFNFISALIMMIVAVMIWGIPVSKSVVTNIAANSKALSYLQKGDILVSINDTKLTETNASQKLTKDADNTAKVVVERNGKEFTYIIPMYKNESGQKVIGFEHTLTSIYQKENLIKSVKDGTTITGGFFKITFLGLKMLFTGQISVKQVSGPVTIVKTTSDIAKSSIPLLVYWIVLLNINIGIMNVLPIPALDGGQVVFLILETILGESWNRKIANTLNNIVLTGLFIFIIFVTYNDIIGILFK